MKERMLFYFENTNKKRRDICKNKAEPSSKEGQIWMEIRNRINRVLSFVPQKNTLVSKQSSTLKVDIISEVLNQCLCYS